MAHRNKEDSSEAPLKPQIFLPEPAVSDNPPRHRFVSFGSKPSFVFSLPFLFGSYGGPAGLGLHEIASSDLWSTREGELVCFGGLLSEGS